VLAATFGLVLGVLSPLLAAETQVQPGEAIRLEQGIALAKEHSGLLKMAAHNLAQAEAKVKEARASLLPQLDASLAYTGTNAESPSITIPGLPPITMPGNPPFTTQIAVNQPLFVDPLRVQYQLAQKTLTLRQLEYEDCLDQVTFNVTNAYYQVVKAQLGTEIAQRSLAQAEANLRTAQAHFSAGILVKNQVLQMELAVANARLNALRAGNFYELALASLRMMIGRDQQAALRIVPELAVAPDVFPDELTPAMVERRFDVQKARLAMDLGDLGARMARAGYYPVASLNLAYITRDDMPTLADGTFSVTVGIKWSWSVGGKTAAAIRAAEEDRARAEDAYQMSQDHGRLEIIQTHLEWFEASRRTELTVLALSVARENLRLATRRYEVGAGTPQEAAEAQLSLEQAEMNDLNARYGLFLSGLKLVKALGLNQAKSAGPEGGQIHG